MVTADALNCQRDIAQQVIDHGVDYVLALKGNQGTLFEDVKLFLDDPAVALETADTTDGEHGRIEVRRATLSGSSGKSCGLGQERDAGLAARPMTAPSPPDEGMAVRVPVRGRLRDRLR